MLARARTVNLARPKILTTRQIQSELCYWALALMPAAVVILLPGAVVGDAGLHLASAAALNGLVDGRWPGLLHWASILQPNSTVEVLLAFLVRLIDPGWAVRLICIVALVGFAVAVAMITKSLKSVSAAGILLLPFQASFPFNQGFVGFVVGLPIALAAIALTLRDPNRHPLKVSILLVVAWFTHLFPAMIGAFVVTTVIFLHHYEERSRAGRRLIPAAFASIRPIAISTLPVIFLTATWLITAGTQQGRFGNPEEHGVYGALRKTVSMSYSTRSYSGLENYFYWVVAGALYLTAGLILVWRIRTARVDGFRIPSPVALDGLLIASFACTVVAIVMPDTSGNGGAYLAARTALFGPIFLGIWIIGNVARSDLARSSAAARRSFVVSVLIAGLVVVGVTIVRLPSQIAIGKAIEPVKSVADCFPKNSTYVQLNLDDLSRYTVRTTAVPLQSGLVAAEKNLLALNDEAGWVPYYLFRFNDVARADKTLLTGRAGAENTPPEVDIDAAIRSGLPLQAVLLFGRRTATTATLEHTSTVAAIRDLDSYFHKTRESTDGQWELWVRNGVPSPCG